MWFFKNFTIYQGKYFAAYFHAECSSKSAVYEYYRKCDMPTRANLLYLVKRMADHGAIFDQNKFRLESKQHKIYAFKAKKERFFCFFKKDKVIIIASAYRKRSQRVDRRALRKAINIQKLYFKNEG